MTLTEALALLCRRWLEVAGIVILTAVAAGTFAGLQPRGTESTLIMSISVESRLPTDHMFDAAGLSNQFADTISGWFRSPELSDDISELAGAPVAASVDRQATGNFLLKLNYADAKLEAAAVKAAREVLEAEVAKYNANSKFTFTINRHGELTQPTGANPELAAAAGAFGGAGIAVAYLLILAIATGRITAASQAEEILGVPATIRIRNLKSEEVAFLDQLLRKTGKDTLLAGVNLDPAQLAAALKHKPELAKLPKDADKLAESRQPILLVRLDTSREQTLRHARALLRADAETRLVVLG